MEPGRVTSRDTGPPGPPDPFREPGHQSTGPRWWPQEAWLRGDLGAVAFCAGLVAILLPHRADWASHVLLGGGLAVVALAGPVPLRWRSWSAGLGALGVLALAVLLDLTVTGPFDPADVAFTLVGALAVTGPRDHGRDGVPPGGDARWQALGWGVALVLLAVLNRYSVPRGP